MKVLLLLIVALAFVNGQSNAGACVAGPNPCAIFQTLLIQTSPTTNLTTIVINVTNVCSDNVYYVQFAMSSPASLSMNPPVTLKAQLDTSVNYLAHYQWQVSYAPTTVGNGDVVNFLVFTPAANTPGVSGNPPVQTAYVANSNSGWSWEIFSFQVSGYIDPTYPWYWQAHVGSTWDTFGPLDMSNCYCANCDAGYFQRLIQNCDLGYLDPITTTYNDFSTNLSASAFNENKVLYAFAIVGDWIQMFYSDEHALIMGYDKVTVNGKVQLDVSTSVPAVPPGPSGQCITGTPINIGITNFDSTNPLSNVDANNYQTGCAGGPLCGRPMPPSLFITDITNNPNSRAGDWQFGGTPQMPHKICGTWKYATKAVTTPQTNSDGSLVFDVNTDADPNYILRNNAGTNWALGSGADPLPIPSISAQNAVNPGVIAGLGLDLYGAEIAWNFNNLNPPLDPSRNYRLQFMVHDGDQTRVGGDVGQACVDITAACPPGFAGPSCKQCDLYPPPGNAWTWYCFPTGQTNPVYNLLKVPTSKLTQSPYLNSGGFVPGNTVRDPAGYIIGCDCTRHPVPCPQSCCGNGVCDDRFGNCSCTVTTTPVPGASVNLTSCCVPPIPPCLNNGQYCSGKGTCNIVTNLCTCQNTTDGSTITGAACNITVPPPAIPCPASCCGNGNCNERNGVCNCTDLSQPNTNATSCCIGPQPPCYNDGQYCSGRGNCVSGECVCVTLADKTTYNGSACNTTVPPPQISCPESCCGNGRCDTTTGTCTCTAAAGNINETTCCDSIINPPCYNNGQYCNGKGDCVNGTCECHNTTDGSKIEGSTCNITIPPPPKNCSSTPTTNCNDCLNTAIALGINCVWCPSSNGSTMLTNGICSEPADCPAGVGGCIPPTLFIPPPCPDHCSGHGVCTNSTPSSSTNGTNVTLVCACSPGFSGINCGVGNTEAIIGVGLGTAAVAGIILAVALIVACAGGGAYAVVSGAGAGAEGTVANNPLYKPDNNHGHNPLYRG